MSKFYRLLDMTSEQLHSFGYLLHKQYTCADCFIEDAAEVPATILVEGDHRTTRILCDRHAEKVRRTR